jgi:hypothetical protein
MSFSVSFEDLRCRPGPVMRTRLKRAGQSATTSATVHDLVVAAMDEPGAICMNRPGLWRGQCTAERSACGRARALRRGCAGAGGRVTSRRPIAVPARRWPPRSIRADHLSPSRMIQPSSGRHDASRARYCRESIPALTDSAPVTGSPRDNTMTGLGGPSRAPLRAPTDRGRRG